MARTESWQPLSELLGHLATIAAAFVDREIEGAKLAARADIADLKRAAGRYGLAALLGTAAIALLIASVVAIFAGVLTMAGMPTTFALGFSALVLALALAGLVWWLYRAGNAIMQDLALRIDSAIGLFAPPGTNHRALHKQALDGEEDG